MAKPKLPEPISVFGLGLGGVNLVKSPVHLDDNEVIQAQNAEPYRERGQTGIRKRPALRPVNSSALAAAIQGVLPVELAQNGAGNTLGAGGSSGGGFNPDPGTPGTPIVTSGAQGLVLVARNTHPATKAWKYTVDGGTTWATTTALSTNIANSDHNAVIYNGRAFYAGEDDSIGQILCFDGQSEFEFCRLPGGPSAATAGGTKINAVGFALGYFVISLNDGTTGRVFLVDPVTGSASQLGGTFVAADEVVVDVAALAGRIWVCTNNDNTKAAHIYSIRPNLDSAWTTERTTGALAVGVYRGYNSLAALGGQLYAATGAPAGYAAIIEVRSAAGSWSTELTSSDITNDNYYDALTVWNGVLYGQYAGGTVVDVVKRASAGSWAQDKDMAAAGSTTTWGFLVTPDTLYASGPPRVFTKVGTTWSTSLSDADLTHGMLI